MGGCAPVTCQRITTLYHARPASKLCLRHHVSNCYCSLALTVLVMIQAPNKSAHVTLLTNNACVHTLRCTHRTFTLPANVTTLNDKVASVQLTKPDSATNNNFDDARVSPFVTCAAPNGLLSAAPACPAGRAYVGPDTATLTDPTAYGTTCCVSVTNAVRECAAVFTIWLLLILYAMRPCAAG